MTSRNEATSQKEERSLYIGEFEELVLLAILKLFPNAYGVSLRDVLEEVTKRSVTVGALYATLERLEKKGLISSRLDEPTPERGGRAKKFFEVEAGGKQALRQAENNRRALVPKLVSA